MAPSSWSRRCARHSSGRSGAWPSRLRPNGSAASWWTSPTPVGPGPSRDIAGSRDHRAPRPGGCPRCGSPLFDGERFCEACGAPGRSGSPARRVPDADDAGGAGPGRGRRDGSRPVPRHDVDLDAVGTATDVGLRRHRNEDAAALPSGRAEGVPPPSATAWPRPGTPTWRRGRRRTSPSTWCARSVEGVEDADGGGGDVGPSLRCRPGRRQPECGPRGPARWSWHRPRRSWPRLVVADAVVVASIGDSRAYWLGATGPAVLLTMDDSLAQDRIAEGTPAGDRIRRSRRPHDHPVARRRRRRRCAQR